MAAGASATGSLSARIPDVSQLTGLLGELKEKVGGSKIPELPLAQIQSLTARFDLKTPDTSGWKVAIPSDVGSLLSNFPDAATLTKPLADPIAKLNQVLSISVTDELQRAQDAITTLSPAALDSPEAFVNGLLKPISEIGKLIENSEAIKLVGTVAGFFGAKDVEKAPGAAAAALADLETLLRDRVAGTLLAVLGLASIGTTVTRTERLVGAVRGAFSWQRSDELYRAVLAAFGEGGGSLAAVLRSGSPDAMRARITGVTDAFDAFQLGLARDLGFSEALVATLDTGALQSSLKSAADALAKLDTGQMKALAASVQKVVEGFQKTLRIDPGLDLAKFKQLLGDGLVQLKDLIDKIDLSKVRDALQKVLKTIEAPFQILEELKTAIETAVRSAFSGLKDALGKIDFSAIQKSATQFLDQVGEAIAEIDKLFTETRDAIQGVLKAAADSLGEVKTFVLDPQSGLKKKIEDVFGAVFSLLDGLHLKEAIDEVNGILQPISVNLGKIEFAPVFDATADAIGTVNDVLKTVAPLLVTDDLKQKLTEATAFLRKIDFDQIASELNQVFDEILSSMNEDALGAIKSEYQKVVDSIDKFDPAPALESIQKEVFDPLIAQLEKVKPAELLKPVQDGFDTAMAELRKFNPTESLSFATKFFDDLLAKFHEISPDKLLQPVQQMLGDVQQRIDKVLQIDKVIAALNQITDFLDPVLKQIEVGPLLNQMAAGFQELKAAIAELDLGGLFEPIAGAFEAAFTRVGALVEGSGVIDALQSISAKGTAFEDRLLALPAQFTAAAAEVNKLDLNAALTTLRGRFGEAKAAFEGRASAGPVDVKLQLTALDPAAVLTPMLPKLERVRAAFAAKSAALDALVASLKPDLQPASNIRDALASFLSVFDLARQMLLDPLRQLTGKPNATIGDVLIAYLDELDPAKWRAQMEPAMTALHNKIQESISAVVLDPITEALGSLKKIGSLLDISTLIQPVTEIFAEVEQLITQLSPAPIVKALDEKYQQILATLEKLNPAQFIAEIQKLFTDDVVGVIKAISPVELLLPPVKALFDKIKGLLVSLDVEVVFKPILEKLKSLKSQLTDGLGRTGAAYKQMLTTLDSAGGESASVSVSVAA